MGHGFSTNRSPIQNVYLVVPGGAQPEEAPEVYYRFTARTLERHGGVPLGSTYHKANVTLEDGVWKAELVGPTFGTIEVFSRFKVDGTTVYSQYNFLHFIRDEDAQGVSLAPIAQMPQDWPVFDFPSSSYNDMPFRGTQTENSVDFDVKQGTDPVVAQAAYLVELRDGTFLSSPMSIGETSGKYNMTPADDPLLPVVSGPMGGGSASKTMLALLELPDGNVMTFSLNVSRSKWSYRKLGLGLIFVLVVSIVVGMVTADRRARFKYNEYN
jgi:hypothetical protein